MSIGEIRSFALSLPETTEEPHFDKTSFRVRGKIFATIPPDGDHIHIFVDEHETRAVVEEAPDTFEELWWGRRLMGIRVRLEAADLNWVFELLEEAWRLKAPKSLVKQWEENGGSPEEG